MSQEGARANDRNITPLQAWILLIIVSFKVDGRTPVLNDTLLSHVKDRSRLLAFRRGPLGYSPAHCIFLEAVPEVLIRAELMHLTSPWFEQVWDRPQPWIPQARRPVADSDVFTSALASLELRVFVRKRKRTKWGAFSYKMLKGPGAIHCNLDRGNKSTPWASVDVEWELGDESVPLRDRKRRPSAPVESWKLGCQEEYCFEITPEGFRALEEWGSVLGLVPAGYGAGSGAGGGSGNGAAEAMPETRQPMLPAWKRLKLRRSRSGICTAKLGECSYRIGDRAYTVLETLQKAEGELIRATSMPVRPDIEYKRLPPELKAILDKPGRGKCGWAMK